MSQIRSYREGRQSENVAQFLLYPLAFLSEPLKVNDDIGVDFFCTLFAEKWVKTNAHLIPLNSFAIQTKSDGEKEEVFLTKQLDPLRQLEVPYFIGIVNRDKLTLNIYSGEYLSHFFVYKGKARSLKAELCDRSVIAEPFDWLKENGDGDYTVRFPKVTELKANMEREERKNTVAALREVCALMLNNISAINRKEFILQNSIPPALNIYAGPASLQFCESNFNERLTEVLFAMQWLHKIDQGRPLAEGHFRVFERVYMELCGGFGEENLPSLLVTTYLHARKEITGKNINEK